MGDDFMKNRAAKKALIFAIVLVVIAAGAFGGHQLRRELTVSYAWPDVVLLVEDEPQPDFVHSEFYGEQRSFMNRVVGGDMILSGGGGADEGVGTDSYYLPSLGHIRTLFMPEYAHNIIYAPADTEYLSVSCSQSEMRKRPHSVAVYRLSLETAESLPAGPDDWEYETTILPLEEYGTKVQLEKHGGSYRIYEPEINCVYVCRSVWDNGVIEHAWIVMEE